MEARARDAAAGDDLAERGPDDELARPFLDPENRP